MNCLRFNLVSKSWTKSNRLIDLTTNWQIIEFIICHNNMKNNAMINLEQYYNEIKQICDSLPVKRLGLFGSVLNKDFENPFFKKSIEQSREIIYER